MSETTVFRSEVETLRAENARLAVFAAGLEARVRRETERETEKAAKVPMRWTWNDDNAAAWIPYVLMWIVAVLWFLAVTIFFISTGSLPPINGPMLRGLLVFSILALAWCLAFVRRVPR